MGYPTEGRRHAQEFEEKGFTVFPSFFSKDETRAMLEEVERCLREDNKRPALHAKGIDYTGGIFLRSQLMRDKITSQRLIDALTPIAGPDLWVMMDIAVLKRPGGGIFRWHQDNGYNYIRAPYFQCWIALTETNKKNGTLTLAPGSHKRGRLPHKFVGDGQMEVQAPIGDTISVDADAGDVVLFSSYTLHCTGPNEADTSRVAYVAEFMKRTDFAPQSKPPYLIVSENGRAKPHFARIQRGAFNLPQQLAYVPIRLRNRAVDVARPILGPIKRRIVR